MIQLGLELVGPRPLDVHLLEAEQLLVVGRVQDRQDVAAFHARALGGQLEQDRRPPGGCRLAADADGEPLEPAFDDGLLSALDPAAGPDHREEVGATHIRDGKLLVRRLAGAQPGPSPPEATDRGHRQGDDEERHRALRGPGLPLPLHCKRPLLAGVEGAEGSPAGQRWPDISRASPGRLGRADGRPAGNAPGSRRWPAVSGRYETFGQGPPGREPIRLPSGRPWRRAGARKHRGRRDGSRRLAPPMRP